MSPALVPGPLRFVAAPPGLEPIVDFTLAAVDATPGLFSLTAANGAARLYVLDAALHLPQYTPQLPGTVSADLGTNGESSAVLVVVNPGVQSTVNLAAPIVVNAATGTCVQVILEGTDWPLRQPLVPA
ncbi:MAG: flagellar assembly protein FliW [Specibacter sp.]